MLQDAHAVSRLIGFELRTYVYLAITLFVMALETGCSISMDDALEMSIIREKIRRSEFAEPIREFAEIQLDK